MDPHGDIARLVMRNRVNRKDAVYVIRVWASPDKKQYAVIACWGPWDRYDPPNVDRLQYQVKRENTSGIGARLVARDLFQQKFRRGYRLVPELSWAPYWLSKDMGIGHLSSNPPGEPPAIVKKAQAAAKAAPSPDTTAPTANLDKLTATFEPVEADPDPEPPVHDTTAPIVTRARYLEF